MKNAEPEETRAWAFIVPGEPIPQPRPRVGAGGKRGTTARRPRAYLPTDHPIRAFKHAVAIFARRHGVRLLTGAVECRIVFVLKRPKSQTRKRGPNPREWHAKRPDVDNLVKAVLDGLNGLAWLDDGQVAVLRSTKWVAAGGEAPRTEIEIRELWELEGEGENGRGD